MNFPIKEITPYNVNTDVTLLPGLGTAVAEIYQHKSERLLIVLNSEDEVIKLQPNLQLLKYLKHSGITITAKSNNVDFVSRTFYPHKSVYNEDAVTGAAHCMLAPYWARQLEKNTLYARQVSQRGGICVVQ